MAFSVQEVFSLETYGRTSWSSVVAAAVGGFYFQSLSFSFVCLFVCFFSRVIGASTPASSLKMTRVRNKGEDADENLWRLFKDSQWKQFIPSLSESGICVITLPASRGRQKLNMVGLKI